MGTPTIPPEETLTTRQMQCIKLLVEGLSYAAIGERLDISFDTVRKHLQVAYEKLGINNKKEAVAWWNSRFGAEAELFTTEALLADAEKTLEALPAGFHRAVEAEAGRLMRRFIAAQAAAK